MKLNSAMMHRTEIFAYKVIVGENGNMRGILPMRQPTKLKNVHMVELAIDAS